MTTWLSRAAGADALRDEIAALRADTEARIAEAGQRRDEMIEAMGRQIGAMADDLARAAERLDGLVAASEAMGARLGQLETAGEASHADDRQRGQAVDSLRGALARHEQQLKLHIDESAMTWAALIERVELARLAAHPR